MNYNDLVKTDVEKDIKRYLENPLMNIPKLDAAIEISKRYGIDLHPRYLYYWNELVASEFILFLEFLRDNVKNELGSLKFPKDENKRTFEIIGIEHEIESVSLGDVKSEKGANLLVIDNNNSKALMTNLGVEKYEDWNKQIERLITYTKDNLAKSPVEILNKCSFVGIRDKGGSYIGARMGRPEKAKMRKQFNDETRSHALFPVGEQGGRSKNVIEAFRDSGYIEEEFRTYLCKSCNTESIYPKCEVCKSPTIQQFFEKYTFKPLSKEDDKCIYYQKKRVDTNSLDKDLRNVLGRGVEYPKVVKGISGTINKHHSVEHIAKGFLRALNGVYVNKDGTVRYDMIEMGLTHFRPVEIGTSIEKLKELGYNYDYLGNPLENDDQLIEILPQDVVLPDCVESGDELASDYILNTANYVDDLLEKLYGLNRYYNFKSREDTIGHLIIGLAPHTSAGIVGRIIGYSKTQGCFSHPVWHAAQRRNLDGDENGIMLLLDGLINFSREFLPDRRGTRTMDVSLVLTSHLYLDQIDDEVHGMDIVNHYPLDFYRANKEYKSPKDVKIEKVDDRLKIEEYDKSYLGYHFTHDTTNMNDTVMCSSYKSVPSMTDKLDLQLNLGRKLRAVDENKVGSFVIDKHFMKDIKGNLRKFSMQTFRCTSCGTKFRRPPLIGKCTKCGSASINFTIHEGSIKKYLNPSFKIISEYEIDPYIVETLELANLRVEGVFGKDLEKQKSLSNYFK